MLYKNNHYYFGFIAISIVVLILGATNKLPYYIHPRNTIFTMIMTYIGLVLYVIHSIKIKKIHNKSNDISSKLIFTRNSIFILFMIAIVFFKPSTLTNATTEQRGLNSSSGITISSRYKKSYTQDFSKLGVKDLSSLMLQSADPAYFIGKKVKISGFIVKKSGSEQNIFYVSRFIVSCCAVDATPVGVAVIYDNASIVVVNDQWVEVEGSYKVIENAGTHLNLVVHASSFKEIEKPSKPYEF